MPLAGRRLEMSIRECGQRTSDQDVDDHRGLEVEKGSLGDKQPGVDNHTGK